MKEIGPFAAAKPPLSAGARFIRGFRRVGVVAAVFVLVCGLAITVYAIAQAGSAAAGRYEQANCVMAKFARKEPVKSGFGDNDPLLLKGNGCDGPEYSASFERIVEMANAPPSIFRYAVEPVAIGLPAALAVAAGVYVFFWVLGWLCAGFTRD